MKASGVIGTLSIGIMAKNIKISFQIRETLYNQFIVNGDRRIRATRLLVTRWR